MISRRHFLAMALSLLGQGILSNPAFLFGKTFPQVFVTQLKYRGGNWDPNPLFIEPLIEELELRTSIDASMMRRVVELADRDLFFCPFLYMAGRYAFDPFTQEERDTLRRFLTFGGFLFAEDTVGAKGFGFDQAFRMEMEQVLPDNTLKRLPPDHSVYQSFYLINSIGGRQNVSPFLEGITIDNWTPVIYSQNDLSGAWSRDRFGKWVNDCVPGGELQRKAAFKTGINIIVYALTSDYKKDVIHHPFIKRRQNL
jgi:hypothetical protein